MDQIFDRFEQLFKSWVSGSSLGGIDELFEGASKSFRSFASGRGTGDPDLDAAMDELDDFLDMGRTETEARERQRAREERERTERARSGTGYGAGGFGARPGGPPQELVQAYRTLGLAYGTPFPEVKAAYKRLLMLNHPDRNSATPEQLKRSTEISAQLNAAYHRIELWNTKGKLDDI